MLKVVIVEDEKPILESKDKIVKQYTYFETAYRLEMGLEPSSEMRNWMKSYLG